MANKPNPSRAPAFYAPIVIDQAPVREGALKRLRLAQSELDRLNRELSQFNERDKPAFSSWMSSAFAELYRRLEELTRKIYERQLQIEELLSGARHNSYDAQDDEDAAFDLFMDELKDQGFDPDSFDGDELDALFTQFKARNGFGHEGPTDDDDGAFREHDHYEDRELPSQPKTQKSERLKELYRKLVKLLHPDLAEGEVTEERRTLWLRLQAAYNEGNLAKLESIFALLEKQVADEDQIYSSISEILELVEQTWQSIAQLRKRLKNAQRDRAWGFSRPGAKKRKSRVQQLIRRELEREIDRAQAALDELDWFLKTQRVAS